MATAADVRAFYGEPSPYSLRACVALLDGKPVALGGYAYRAGLLYAFLELKEEMRTRRVSIARFTRRLVEIFDRGMPGMAIAAPDEPTADRFLRWVGFEYVGACDDGEVYRWRKQP